jgi:serine O-acetyltransferase
LVNKSVPSDAIVSGNPAKIIGWVKDLDYNIFENPKDKEGIAPYLKYEK